MRWIRTVLHELWGLFVEDGRFALSILVWVAAVVVVLPHFAWGRRCGGILLFAGLPALLAESVFRYVRADTQRAR